ncbi:hypothetical protein LSCM1_04644 [Leishmania martiniquensis]|uniref:Uncharacterized protein n=1 Tax=Leishmania martiniquensis TaxID=1580590 RepID=A0A836GSN7_9TRYP|nr:hypothetical protein LSCM1_04644 [Leishmania martiniquensis]
MLLRRGASTASTSALVGYVRSSTCSSHRSISAVTSALLMPSHQRFRAPALYSSPSTPVRVSTSLNTQSRHAATSTAASPLTGDEVPKDVLQRVAGRKEVMLRLLRLASGQVAVPVEKMEDVFKRHAGFVETNAASPRGERAPLMTAPEWRTAVWRTLRLECYFTAVGVGSGGEGSARGGAMSVVPLDWAAVVRRAATEIPYEGWAEPELFAYLQRNWPVLQKYAPVWLPRYSGVSSFAQLVHRHFNSMVTATRSAVTGEVLYHRTGYNSVSVTWRASLDAPAKPPAPSRVPEASEACTAVQHALHLLGRGHQLPVWTDVSEVAPLLSAHAGLSDGRPSTWYEAFTKDAELRGTFQLEGFVRVRAAQTPQRLMAIVDCTSVSPAELTALLREHPPPGGSVTVKLLLRDGMAPELHEAYVRTCTEAVGPSTLVEDVPVDALLEPEHVLAALLETVEAGLTPDVASAATAAAAARPAESSAAAEDDEPEASEGGAPLPSSTPLPVMVLCGAASREAMVAVVEVVRAPKVAITVLTPEALKHA